jgi:hypothetical protein
MLVKLALTLTDIQRSIDPETSNKGVFCTPNLTKWDVNTGTLDFVTRCSGSVNAWNQRVRFEDWGSFLTEEILEQKYSWDQIIQEYPEILSFDARIHCDCPAYLYWGYAYINTQLDTQLVNEDRFPGVRNPGLDGIICKHISSILSRYFL